MEISDCGHPGVCTDTNSTEDVFDIEVETLLDQAPTVSCFSDRHKYHALKYSGRLNIEKGINSTIVKESCGSELS